MPFSFANTSHEGLLKKHGADFIDIICIVEIYIGDAPCLTLARSVKPVIDICVLIGAPSFEIQVPELYDDGAFLRGDNMLCGPSTYYTQLALTDWFLSTELELTSIFPGDTPWFTVGPDLTESKLGTYQFTFFRAFDTVMNLVF